MTQMVLFDVIIILEKIFYDIFHLTYMFFYRDFSYI